MSWPIPSGSLRQCRLFTFETFPDVIECHAPAKFLPRRPCAPPRHFRKIGIRRRRAGGGQLRRGGVETTQNE